MLKEFKIKASADDLELAAMVATPDAGVKVRGVVQLVHGMCEHKERYEAFMQYLADDGLVAVIHDHRGHGASVKSPEDLGYMYDGGWQALVGDTKVVCDWAKSQYPGVPFTMFGHSMGSMVVRSFAKRYDNLIDRLVVCGSPSNNPAAGVAQMLARGIAWARGWHHRPQLIQRLAFAAFNKPYEAEGFASGWVCSDRAVLEAYHSDPLCQYVFTANGFYNLFGLIKDCYSQHGWVMKNSDMPVHFISGAEDPCRLTDKKFHDAVEAMRRVGYRNVDSRLFAGMRHEILNETDKRQVWQYVLDRL